jgi:hypothetical protein
MTRLIWSSLACLVLGMLLLVVLELTLPGVVLLFAFIITGVFAIADPAFLAGDDDASSP